jgi:hypothetical protein
MQARCPRCASIFTTDRSGLQFCPNCGQQVDVPAFPGAPPEGTGAGWGGPSGPGGPGSFGPGPAVREDTPWERRATIGWASGLFETWKRVVFSPQPFWASVKPNGSWTDAVLYAWILATAGAIISIPFGALGMGGFGMQRALDQLGSLPPAARDAIRNAATGSGVGRTIFAVLFYPLILIIWGGIQHLFCMLFGVSKHGYFATLRVLAYAASVSIFGSIPCIGSLAGLYTLVLIVLGLSSVQESSVGRASAAVLVPILLVCCCVAGAAVLGAGAIAAMLSSHGQ